MGRITKMGSVGVAVLALAWAAPQRLAAQEWSDEQTEVWKTVEAYSKADAERDLKGFESHVHDDYLGWWNRDSMPLTKSEVRTLLEHDFATQKIINYRLKPVGIRVLGDFAFVHYYWQRLVKDAEGKEALKRGRWTDILTKKGDKWLLIGDHGGPENGEAE